jgi:hypothetical protein
MTDEKISLDGMKLVGGGISDKLENWTYDVETLAKNKIVEKLILEVEKKGERYQGKVYIKYGDLKKE